MINTSMNTVFIDEYSNQKKEIQVLRSVTQRLAKEKQELEIQIEVQQRTIADLRDKLESKWLILIVLVLESLENLDLVKVPY